MKEIKLVTATQKSKEAFYAESALGSVLEAHAVHNVDSVEIVENNSAGLCEVYNRYITEENRDTILVFVHDDVIISDIQLKKKLNDAIEKFDIVGVAGTAEFGLKQPVVWHNSPKNKWSGGVEHPKPTGELYVNSYGSSRKKCLVIDGLFIAINTEKILDAGVKFDEDFTFHFYDLAFCIDANFAGLRVGTWNIPLTHMSHGDYNNEVWRQSEQKFIEKYKAK